MALASVVQAAAIDQIRLTPDEITAKEAGGAGAGTSGVAGIRTTVLLGDPTKPGLYTIRLSIPANTTIQAHTHRDDRSAIVMSGTWYFGYGSVANADRHKAVAAGQLLHRARWCGAFRTDKGRARGGLHHGIWSDGHRLSECGKRSAQ